MTTPFKSDKYLDVLAQSMGLKIEDAWRDGVKSHLANAEKMAKILENAKIPNTEFELANTFNASIQETAE